MTYRLVVDPLHHEPPEGLPGQNVASPASEVALVLCSDLFLYFYQNTDPQVFEMMAKVDRIICAVVSEEILEVLHYHEGVIVRLHEPLKLLEVVVVDVLEALLGLAPQPLPPLLDLELDSAQLAVLLGAHEEQLVAVATPGVLNMDCLKIVVKSHQ